MVNVVGEFISSVNFCDVGWCNECVGYDFMLLVVLLMSSKSLENVVPQNVLIAVMISCESIISSSQMIFTSGRDCPKLRLSERSLLANCAAENG